MSIIGNVSARLLILTSALRAIAIDRELFLRWSKRAIVTGKPPQAFFYMFLQNCSLPKISRVRLYKIAVGVNPAKRSRIVHHPFLEKAASARKQRTKCD